MQNQELMNKSNPNPRNDFFVWVGAIFRMIFLFIRLPIFFVLFWLRGIVVTISNFIGSITLFACFFCWFAHSYAPNDPMFGKMIWPCAIASLCFFILGWLYDYVIMWISPQDMSRIYY